MNRFFAYLTSALIFIFYYCIILLLVYYKMYFTAAIMIGIIIILIIYLKFNKYRFLKYGEKKQGYVSFFNDYSGKAGKYGRYPSSIEPLPQIDIIVNDGNSEIKISSKKYFKYLDSSKFWELATSNKKIYVDVYFIKNKYYVDYKSLKIK